MVRLTLVTMRCLGWMALLLLPLGRTEAQDVVSLLREQRFLTRAHDLIRQHGERPVPRPYAPHPWADSTLAARLGGLPFPARPGGDSLAAVPPPQPRAPFEVWSVVPIRKLQQPFFERQFADTKWAFLGSNHVTTLDTTLTWRLRAALEAAYGSPTNTVVEVGQSAALTLSNAIQFEYWLVVNDSIPVIVTDVSGPLDRGLIISSDQRLRDRLPDLLDALFNPLAHPDADRSPFADYFYDVEGRSWYLVGFDGTRFIMRATPRPTLRTGRPLIEALRR